MRRRADLYWSVEATSGGIRLREMKQTGPSFAFRNGHAASILMVADSWTVEQKLRDIWNGKWDSANET
uniref:Uncharacterized protein n=1 Tax=Ascaris lumbricoides TaxID=6252 RepID=A0A0M3HWK5_ASCLU